MSNAVIFFVMVNIITTLSAIWNTSSNQITDQLINISKSGFEKVAPT